MAAITLASGGSASSLQTLFSKIQHVYYVPNAIQNFASSIEATLELPVLEDSLNFNTGDVETTEVKILDGTIWTSMSNKGDSDITMQVSSMHDSIVTLFLTKKNVYGSTDQITIMGDEGFAGAGWALDVKKTTGALVMRDDTGDVAIILPNVEMYGALVAGDGENPAYFNVKVTPKTNSAGDSIIVLER